MELSIIIVSWNVADLLTACLSSIKTDKLETEIIVVDSASSDQTVEMVRSQFPHVKLLPQSENVGFTRGNNIGLQVAQGRYLLLLNPDTEVIDDALHKMVTYMDAHPQAGIVGPHTLNSDKSTQSTKRRFPSVKLGFFESTWLQSYAPKALMDAFYAADIPDNATADVDWVQGSALMARREVYQQIGGLDEGYVMFSEELDWCKRAKDAGWQVVYFGDAQIIHHGGKSTEQVVGRKHIYFQQSKLRYYRKFHGVGTAFALRAFLLVSYGVQIMVEGAKSLLGHKRTLRNERIRAYWQVLRSGLKVN